MANTSNIWRQRADIKGLQESNEPDTVKDRKIEEINEVLELHREQTKVKVHHKLWQAVKRLLKGEKDIEF